jgi:hypothetical protein
MELIQNLKLDIGTSGLATYVIFVAELAARFLAVTGITIM